MYTSVTFGDDCRYTIAYFYREFPDPTAKWRENDRDTWLISHASGRPVPGELKRPVRKKKGERERESEEARETMVPKRKTRATAPTAGLSPRKTRSGTAGKRADPPPAKKAKPSSNGEPKKARGGRRKAEDATAKEKTSDAEEAPVSPAEEDDSAAVVPSKTVIIEAW